MLRWGETFLKKGLPPDPPSKDFWLFILLRETRSYANFIFRGVSLRRIAKSFWKEFEETFLQKGFLNHLLAAFFGFASTGCLRTACAAESLAMGTLKGEHET